MEADEDAQMDHDKETINGTTDGYGRGARFELTNGQV